MLGRCEALASISEEPDRLTRRFATDALRRASECVAEWMREAGMTTRRDAVGNVVGRYEPDRGAPRTLLLGSHLDTVRDAGRFDGPLGIMVALACVERTRGAAPLPFAIEIVGFADEEGLRFHTAYLGSQVLAGTFDPRELERTDDDGTTLADAIRAFGGDPRLLSGARRDASDLLGYCEVHIEQGPVLEDRGAPVGVVSGIVGQSRIAVRLRGVAGHAGTVPMDARRDALCGAAELVLAAEALARSRPGLVATVGQIATDAQATNVIPGGASLSLDLRHADDAERDHARDALRASAAAICARRRLSLDWRVAQETPSVATSPRLSALLGEAISAAGLEPHHLASGAGHDAVALAELTEVAMLFVRCRDGISHHPAESVELDDVGAAIAVTGEFLRLLAAREGGGGERR